MWLTNRTTTESTLFNRILQHNEIFIFIEYTYIHTYIPTHNTFDVFVYLRTSTYVHMYCIYFCGNKLVFNEILTSLELLIYSRQTGIEQSSQEC